MVKLEEGEKILRIVRRHFLILIPSIVAIIFAAIFPFLIYIFLTSAFLSLDLSVVLLIDNFAAHWGSFGYSVWLLLLWIFFFVEWTDYYLDMIVITDRRVIEVRQKGFFNREVTSFLHSQIQDITVDTEGVLRTLFKFGELHIQTAGHNHEIIIKDAYCPEEARTLILQLEQQSLNKQIL
jgi:energy-coupling factor transporter transmembrane protein EcfT